MMDPQVSPTSTPDLTPTPDPTPAPVQAPAPEFTDVPNPVPVDEISPKKSKRWIWAVVLLAVIVLGAGAWWALRPKAAPVYTSKPAANVSAQDFKFVPRFNQIGAYVMFQDAEWYAAPAAIIKISKTAPPKYYSHDNGLPIGVLTGLVVHDGRLWTSSQNGTAVLAADGSSFTEVPIAGKTSDQEAIQNGKVYGDTATGKLYLSSFTDFFQYNDTAKSWESMKSPKPVDACSMVMNDNFGIATSNHPGSPVWVYVKKTGRWETRPVSGLSDGFNRVFTIGKDLFIMGRSAAYSSCADAGKTTATVAYHLDETGNWQPITAFNGDKSRPEMNASAIIKSTTQTVYSHTCNASDKTKVYDLKFADGVLSTTNERAAAEGVGYTLGDDGEQQVLIDELMRLTGLYASTRALAVDKGNNIIFSYGKTAGSGSSSDEEGLAIANGSDFGHSTSLEVAGFKRGDVVRPVLCDGQMAYVFVGRPKGSEGGPTHQWSSAKLLSVAGTKSSPWTDLGTDVASPVFACSEQKISWLGTSGVKQIDLKTKKLEAVGTSIGENLSELSGQAYALENGDLWLVTVTGNDPATAIATMYFLDSTKATVTKIGTAGKDPVIEAATAENIWISGPVDGPRTTLTMYDLQGAVVYSKSLLSPLKMAATAKKTTLMSGTTAAVAFRPIAFSNLDPLGEATPVSADIKVAVHGDFNGDPPGETYPTLIDASRGRIWINSNFAGLFSVAQ